MQIVLFEDERWKAFLPLAFTRPIGALRIGIYTIAEKWKHFSALPVFHRTRPELRQLFASDSIKGISTLYVNARVLPSPALVEAVLSLQEGQALTHNNQMIAMRSTASFEAGTGSSIAFDGELLLLEHITDLFSLNAQAIALDAPLWQSKNKTIALDASNRVVGDASKVLVAEGAQVFASSFNTRDGFVIIDKQAEVMEGSLVRGPFYLGEHSTLKLGAKIYGATTIGPHCKIGGEVSNSLVMGYSNKGHDGFIGNSILGEWCNLGADTNSSNLKNNYSNVALWDYASNDYVATKLTFCGVIMGDHSKTGINTMLNTGTVVGAFANIFGGGFPPKHIPSFSWGGSDGFERYELDKALATAKKVMERRNVLLNEQLIALYHHLNSEL